MICIRLLFMAVCFTSFSLIETSHSQVTNPRPWAEWEETDGIIIHQPNFYPDQKPSPLELLIAEEWDSLYLDLIRGLLEEGVNIYYILDTNDRPEYHSGILDTMHLKYGINIHNPDFHIVIGCKEDYSALTKWTRDHGPMNVYKNVADSLYFFLFRDDFRGAGGILRDYLAIPDTIFYNAASGSSASDGGNYMVDGHSMGIINGGEGVVLPDIKDFFGLDTVYSLPDYLVHADYYLKIVNEETLILSAHERDNYIYGTEPYTYEQDSAILAGLVAFFQEQVISQYGRPLKVYQVPNPPSVQDDSLQLWWYTQYASYTNSLIVNRSVFVPQFETKKSDSTALEIYREVMPGYKIVPVFSRRGATGGGAVHCLTNSVAAGEPVLIRHAWYCDTADLAPGYEIAANILTRSGVKYASIFWSVAKDGPFQSISMQNVSGDLFSGIIPRPDGADGLYYYITAESNSGRTGIKPIVAPDYCYHIVIRGGAPGWISPLSKASGHITVYPNPVSDILTFDLANSGLSSRGKLLIDLYDQLGRAVYHQSSAITGKIVQVNVQSLSAGQYFLVLINEEGEFCSVKFLVHR